MTQVNVGKNIEIAVDFTTMPQSAIDHCLYIGARNILMDSHASITSDEYPDAVARNEAAMAMVQKKLDALMRGEVRVSTSREGDPVRAEAMRLASRVIVDAMKRAGKIKKAADMDTKLLRNKSAELIASNEAFMIKAREYVESRKQTNVELSDIGL